jgi:hypothetical protein
MKKPISLVLLALWPILMFHGAGAYNSFASGGWRAFTGSPTE